MAKKKIEDKVIGEVEVDGIEYQLLLTFDDVKYTESGESGNAALIVWFPSGSQSIECDFDGTAKAVRDGLKYLNKDKRLNLWQLHQLFAYDGHSSGLAAHILMLSAPVLDHNSKRD